MDALRDEFKPWYGLAEQVMPGKATEALQGLIALLAQGHVLIEDVPGMGKTTLVRFLAQSMGLDFKRVQFTNDLLPADILGVSIFRPETRDFQFRAGAIFTEILLADELNRAPPKTQSALLQAMEERVVTIEGVNHPLPKVFIVMATQNPHGMFGTFPLPESQLDRFLLKFSMGLPTRSAEMELLKGAHTRDMLIQSLFSVSQILEWQKIVSQLKASEALLDYILRLLDESRKPGSHRPLSPRVGLDILRAARAWAYINKRDYVLPEDVQFIFPAVAGHRLASGEPGSLIEHRLARELMARVNAV